MVEAVDRWGSGGIRPLGEVVKESHMNQKIGRRAFLAGTGAAAFSIVSSRRALSAAVEPQRVTIQTGAEIGTVRPELHGHFAEHLGSCVYGGLWGGTKSSIAHVNGYREQAVGYLKAPGIPLLRWPGGCFADDYHLR